MSRYLFLCKIFPKSGMDLMKQNKAISILREMVDSSTQDNPEIGGELEEALASYIEGNEGYVLETVPIVSDEDLYDPEMQVMPEIKKKYPGAELVRFFEIPEMYRAPGKIEIATERIVFN